MKVLLSWLREFAPGIDGTTEQISDALSNLGMAVEEVEHLGRGLDGIVAARVLDLRPHPDADRIQLVDVDPGDGGPLQICCGAFNMGVGDTVPLATLGTVMPDGMEITKRKMRGQESSGMLCSARELGMGDDHGGILVLSGADDPDAPAPGTPVREVLGIDEDVLFDLEINPNRPDAMSVAGVARDLAAHLGVPFALPPVDVAESGPDATDLVQVEILDPDLCGRFLVRVLSGVSVGESPDWVKRRLLAGGMRPINSVVDASNYVMLELGQPNHTYDLAKVAGARLGVRMARADERITTLDGVERELTEADGVIVDGQDTAIGIAGIMGGASTEISETTDTVALELAWWDPMTIARSSKRLGLRSEASARFERGTDPEIAPHAALRFAQVLAQSQPATLHPGAVDAAGKLPDRSPVRVRTARVNALLGTQLTTDQVRGYLEPIGFEVATAHGAGADTDVLGVVVPSFRPDTTTETDVIEEVARHHGYERIAKTVPTSPHTGGLTPRQTGIRALRSALVGLGLAEAMPTPFLAPGDLERCGLASDGISLANPLAAEESLLRTSLLPGLVKTVAFNASHRRADVALFEIGHIFLRPPSGSGLPDEREHLGVVLAGRDARDAVALAERLLASLWFDRPDIANLEVPGLHPTRAGRVRVGSVDVGTVGEIDPGVLEEVGVAERVGWLQLDLSALLDLPHDAPQYRRVSRQPSSDIDLAFAVEDSVPAALVERVIRESAGDLLVALRLFDVFRSEQVGAGRRSLAYSLRLQAPDRTLTDDEIAALRDRCIAKVQGSLPAELRG